MDERNESIKLDSENKESLSVKVLEEALPAPAPVAVEKKFHTMKIEKASRFEYLVSLLKEVKTEVAINFYGVAVGRNGKVGWMVLFLQDTLVCLDVLVLEKLITPFWKILGQELFSNKRITKVAYNTRFIADYLYHNHSIQLVNIYDLQVTECLIRAKKGELDGAKEGFYKKLSEMLESFLATTVTCAELELLKTFEIEDFIQESPFMRRPIPGDRYYKCAAIDIKYILPLKAKLLEAYFKVGLDSVPQEVRDFLLENPGGLMPVYTPASGDGWKAFCGEFEDAT